MKRKTYVLVVTIAYSLGCKPKTEASEKSVDALVQGNATDERLNMECGPGDVLGASAATTEHVKKAWQAIPNHLTPWLGDATNVKLFDDDTCKTLLQDAIAKQFPDDQSKRDDIMSRLSPDACWTADTSADPKQGPKAPILYVKNSATAVQRRLITTAVYAFAEHYVDGIFIPAVKKEAAAKDESVDLSNIRRFAGYFDNLRSELARAYVSELTDPANATYFSTVIDNYKKSPLYGSDQAKWADNIIFKNFVLAEFTDAYYCTADTFKEFATKHLQKTRNAFLPFVKEFGAPWHQASAQNIVPPATEVKK